MNTTRAAALSEKGMRPECSLTMRIDGSADAETRALCRRYIQQCLGESGLLDRARQYRAVNVASELLSNIATHSDHSISNKSRHCDATIIIRFQDNQLYIVTETSVVAKIYRQIKDLVDKYKRISRDNLAAEERQVILMPRREVASSAEPKGLGLGLLSVVRDSDDVVVREKSGDVDRVVCQIRATL